MRRNQYIVMNPTTLLNGRGEQMPGLDRVITIFPPGARCAGPYPLSGLFSHLREGCVDNSTSRDSSLTVHCI